ncbi:hypothetical protein V9W64_10705 [Neisseria leonii]|uniref:Uncharacterized protein n=1 Tax=Neisseria leonii TaxID=2995413 RepID=A0AAQ3XKR6_9NEIS
MNPEPKPKPKLKPLLFVTAAVFVGYLWASAADKTAAKYRFQPDIAVSDCTE